jgi:hypothetical protein
MRVSVRTRLRFVFPHGYMKGREKFGFRICRRVPDVARAGLGALACRRTDKLAYRPRQNHVLVYSAYGAPPGDAESHLILSDRQNGSAV